MKDIIFKGKIQFGIWKFLENVEGVVKPQYGCAQPIENGVHLGNGNNTIEEVGSCEINPPVISCAGATSSIHFPFLVGEWNVEVNGDLHYADGFSVSWILQQNYSGILEAEGDGGLSVGNISASNVRIKLIPEANDDPTPEYSVESGNPTFIEHEDGSLTFCLSKKDEEPQFDIEYVLNGETIHDFVNGIVPASYLQNTAITSLLLHDSITAIDDFAFHGCTSLESLTLSNSLVSIGQYAFNGMFELTSVELPDGLIAIGDRAFTGAKKITSLSIPSSVNSMGDQAFIDCFLLESITVSAVVPPVCTNPFYNTSGGVIPNLFSIYVPSGSVDAYKSATGWSEHAARIFAIP